MTFDYERYCRLAARYAVHGSAPLQLGQEGALGLYFVKEGGYALAGDDTFFLPAGRLAASPAPLALVPAGQGELLGAALLGEAPLALARGLSGPVCFAASRETADAASLLCSLVDPSLEDSARQSALGYDLLCRLARLPADEEALPPLVAAATALIRTHYAEVYGVEELAAQLNVSKGHLIRSFTASMGMPPGKYLTGVRLEAAKAMLLHREYSLDVIAGLCGFSGANYLCRVFKQVEGFTPSAWRRANAGTDALLPELAPGLEEGLYL